MEKMKLEESVQVMKTITHFYSHFNVTEAMVKDWHFILKNYEFEMVMENLRQHVIESKFIPTVADLVKVDSYKGSAYMKIGHTTLETKRQEAERLLMQLDSSEHLKI